MFSFGPVPSRRLGMSLGVNNIPPKVCTYSCIYCQLGETRVLSIERRKFYDVKAIIDDVEKRVRNVLRSGGRIDYITLVPDGEPTLDINLGKLINKLKELGIPVAVITNASLLWMEDVRSDVSESDLVSIKVDAVSDALWRRINRPHKLLNLSKVLEGIREFSRVFNGVLISETMVIDGINYNNEFRRVATYLNSLKGLKKAYIAIPTRPPTESWVRPPAEKVLVRAYNEFASILGNDRIEYLIGLESNEFTFLSSDEEELIRTASVHPLREDIVERFLRKWGRDWDFINNLVNKGVLRVVEYNGRKYFIKSFKIIHKK